MIPTQINQSVFNTLLKYTSGGEYTFINNTQKEYIGYYYKIDNKTYAGEKFDTNNPELIERSRISSLSTSELLNNNTNIKPPTNHVFNYSKPSSYSSGFRYFCVKINNPTLIREMSEDDFNKFSNNPLYKTLKLPFGSQFLLSDIEQAENIIPGISDFLSDVIPTDVDFYPEDLTGGYTNNSEPFSL